MTDTRIVHVVPYYPPHLGGMEKVASSMAEELAKAGQVEVLTTNCAAKEAPRLEHRGMLTIRRLRAFEIANVPVAPSMFLRCLKILTAEHRTRACCAGIDTGDSVDVKMASRREVHRSFPP